MHATLTGHVSLRPCPSNLLICLSNVSSWTLSTLAGTTCLCKRRKRTCLGWCVCWFRVVRSGSSLPNPLEPKRGGGGGVVRVCLAETNHTHTRVTFLLAMHLLHDVQENLTKNPWEYLPEDAQEYLPEHSRYVGMG